MFDPRPRSADDRMTRRSSPVPKLVAATVKLLMGIALLSGYDPPPLMGACDVVLAVCSYLELRRCKGQKG
jgi:hypothetical protein